MEIGAYSEGFSCISYPHRPVAVGEFMHQIAVDPADVIIKEYLLETELFLRLFNLINDMINTQEPDIPPLLQLLDPMVGTKSAVKGAAATGYNPDLRKTPIVNNLLMIPNSRSTKGRLSRSWMKGRVGFWTIRS